MANELGFELPGFVENSVRDRYLCYDWVRSVVRAASTDAVKLADGTPCQVEVDGDCVSFYTKDAEGNPIYHARVRLVIEDPTQD